MTWPGWWPALEHVHLPDKAAIDDEIAHLIYARKQWIIGPECYTPTIWLAFLSTFSETP